MFLTPRALVIRQDPAWNSIRGGASTAPPSRQRVSRVTGTPPCPGVASVELATTAGSTITAGWTMAYPEPLPPLFELMIRTGANATMVYDPLAPLPGEVPSLIGMSRTWPTIEERSSKLDARQPGSAPIDRVCCGTL